MSTDLNSLSLGEEFVSPEEGRLIEQLTALSLARLEKAYPPNAIVTRRAVHPKTHGCVRAEFIVTDEVPEQLRVGVFRVPNTFNAWIRFSSGRPSMHSDKETDTQGMAIKLMGVDGEKVLQGEGAEKRTQDFVMANSPTFFIRDLKEYVAFETDSFNDLPEGLLQKLDLLKHFVVRRESHELMALLHSQKQEVSNPLQIQYWSQTPYKLGRHAIKFSVRPAVTLQNYKPDTPGDDYLQEAMARQLQSEDALFDFLVQVQTDPEAMPVEDAVTEWDEKASPFQKAASIRIPRQSFVSREQFRFAENLSFNPWHSLPEHRPLGSINRARHAIYEAISTRRREMNGAPSREPTGDEVFPEA